MGSKKVKGITIEIGGDTSGLNRALKITKDNTQKLQAELRQVNAALKLDPKNVELLAQKQKLLTKAVEDTKAKVIALKDAKVKADKMMSEGTEVSQLQYRQLEREIAFTEQSLEKLEKQTSKTDQMMSKVAKSADGISQGMTKVGKAMLPLTGAISGAGVASVTMANQFAESMAKVSTIADTTKVPLERLETEILALSNQTGISANLIADDVYNAISAGQDTAHAVEFVANSAKLSKAGFAESAKSLDLLTTILNAYGLEAQKVTNVSDLLIQVQNKGKTTVAELSDNMGKVIPTAKEQNVALEQLGASYAIMTSKGIRTAETTTYLNSMISELGKSSSASAKILKEQTGQSFSELMSSGMSLADVLKIIDDDAKKSNESMGDMFGSAEASKAALTLLDDGVGSFNDSVLDMQNSVGLTEEAFDKLQTPAEGLKISLNTIKNSAIKLGEVMMPLFEDVADGIEILADHLSQLNKDELKNVAVTAGVVASAAPLLVTGGKMIKGVKSLSVATKGLWAIMVAHPIGLLIAATAGLVGGTAYLIATMYDETESQKASRLEHEKMVETMQLQNQEWETLKITQEESRLANLAELGSVQSLWAELQTLADENGNVTEANQNRATFIMGELNNALGTEFTMTGNQIQGYKDSVDAIDDLIEKKKAQIILDSQEPLYKEAILKVNDKMNAQSELAIEMAQNQVEIDSLIAAKAYARRKDGEKQIESKRKQLAEKKIIYDENEMVINDYYKNIATYEETSTAITSGNYEKIKGINIAFGDSFKKAGEVEESELKKQVAIMAITYAELQKKAKSGLDGVKQTTIDEAKVMYQEAIREYEKTGNAIPDGLRMGIDAKAPNVLEATGIFINSIKEWFTGGKGFDTHSPSKFTQTIGVNIMDGLLLGMQSAWSTVMDWLSEKIKWMKDSIRSALNFGGVEDGEGEDGESNPEQSRSLLNYQIPKIPMLATGGVMTSGVAIVGEAGPELLTMLNGKTIVRPLSNSEKQPQTKGVGIHSGIVINQKLIFNTPKTPSPAQTARYNRRATQELLQGV